jgi:hypothetical protein
MNAYTNAVSWQRLCKQVPTATDTNATNIKAVFSVVLAEILYARDIWDDQVSFVRESVKGGLEPGGRGAVTRKRLVSD